MKLMVAAIALSLFTGLFSGAAARERVEEPAFTVLGSPAGLEVRQYGPRIAAETTVTGRNERARNDGFGRLAGYIFGGNTTRTSIAMTAPVAQASEKIAMTAPVGQTPDGSGAWRIQFIMPSRYTLETLPTPKDPSVRLVALEPETFAVLRFSGSTGDKAVSERKAELLRRLDGSGWRAEGEPVAWFYDPPWRLPSQRRNEVAVQVVREVLMI
jgi:hypothetical protein